MKSIRNPLLWLALASVLVCGQCVTGCATLDRPPQTVALDSLQSTYRTAREAYKGAIRLELAGKVSAAKMNEVDEAWNKFRLATQLAVRTTAQDWQSPTPANVYELKNQLFAILKSL
jgi:hypothetical protein